MRRQFRKKIRKKLFAIIILSFSVLLLKIFYSNYDLQNIPYVQKTNTPSKIFQKDKEHGDITGLGVGVYDNLRRVQHLYKYQMVLKYDFHIHAEIISLFNKNSKLFGSYELSYLSEFDDRTNSCLIRIKNIQTNMQFQNICEMLALDEKDCYLDNTGIEN